MIIQHSDRRCHQANDRRRLSAVQRGAEPHSRARQGRGHEAYDPFRHEDISQSLSVGDVVPEVVLINSHDGTSTYKLIAGLHRLICSNGLMVSDGEIDSISVMHKGDVAKDVVDGSHRLIGETQRSLATVQNWTRLQLRTASAAFAESAHTLRFADADGKITTPITPSQLLAPHRRDDLGSDLWHTFNRVQGNTISGGLSAVQRDANGREIPFAEAEVVAA